MPVPRGPGWGFRDVIGSSIGRYDVLEKVGEGGMATVYRGRHNTLERDVAIKVLHPHLSSSARNRERFAREARAIEHLSHRNILEIHDYSGSDAPDCWIVTEFVHGETLTAVLARCRRVPSEVATLIGIALADALDYAHKAGVLHRDLKPDNVMIRVDGTVKLMDFGIARFLDESQVTMTGALVGSPAFMSPEQAREEPLDGRSDLFSLGTLLFLLVTGELPFQGSNPSIILKHIIEGNRSAAGELAPDASGTFLDVVERLLSPSADDRYPDAGAVALALREGLDEIGFDPSEDRWALDRYLRDPDGWERDLHAFLTMRLFERARDALGVGQPLAGLRLINRLLEIDPEHEEALALVKELHGGALLGEPAPPPARWPWLVGAALLIVLPLGWVALREPERAPAVDHDPALGDAASSEGPAAGSASPDDTPRGPTPTDSPAQAADPIGEDAVAEAAIATDPRARNESASTRTTPVRRRFAPSNLSRSIAAVRPELKPDPGEGEDAASGSAEAAPPKPACVAIRPRTTGWGDVFLDGVRIRSTRDRGCQTLDPGTYTFVVRGRAIEEASVTVTLEPGETRDVLVDLVPRPASLRFPERWSEDCTVVVDGEPRGTLASLGRQVTIARPNTSHTVSLRCADGRFDRTYSDGFPNPTNTFYAEGDP